MELRENKWGVSGPVMIAVMDGVGRGKQDAGDAVFQAKTPNLDLFASNPLAAQVSDHGVAVGMPSDGDMGNSEVVHNCIGAGRIFDQGAKLVGEAIKSGRILESQAWTTAIEQVVRQNRTLHFLGLLSDGNVHSHIDHLLALLEHAPRPAFDAVASTSCSMAATSKPVHSPVEQLEEALVAINRDDTRDFAVASGGGRMTTTMDRYEQTGQWSARMARPFTGMVEVSLRCAKQSRPFDRKCLASQTRTSPHSWFTAMEHRSVGSKTVMRCLHSTSVAIE